MPPGTPPTTPPLTGIGGGASSSLIISIFFGIFEGVRNCPVESTSVSITCTTFGTAAAAGGGGGGGGGGATRKVSNCALGNCSVNASGISSSIKTARMLTIKEVVVAKNLRFRCGPNSSRLSENIIRGGAGGPTTSS